MKHTHLRKPLTLRVEIIRQLSQATDRELSRVHGGKTGSCAPCSAGACRLTDFLCTFGCGQL